MAEFIFDLQRFDDNGGDSGNSSGAGGDGSSGSEQGGGDGVSGNGWETRIRNKGEIIFPMFMTSAEADAFAEYSYDVFTTALAQDAVPYYNMQDGVVDSVDFSRFLGSAVLSNDTYDVINLVDTNVGNIIEYYTYTSGDMISLVFDTGAILAFDIGMVSPWFNFANGESMVYSAADSYWYSGEEAESRFVFWNTAVQQTGTSDADNFYVTQNTNTAIFDATGYDNVLLYDATTSDVTDAAVVTDNDITIYFPTGGALLVENSSVFSPDFYLADGASYYYNRDLGEWRDASLKASDLVEYMANAEVEAAQAEAEAAYEAAVEKAVFEQALYESGYNVVLEADTSGYSTFPVSCLANTYIYDAAYDQTVYFYDAASSNVAAMDADGAEINFTFDTGAVATIEYDYNFTPLFVFADGNTIGYDYYTETWGPAYYATEGVAEGLSLSRSNNSLVYQAGSEDTIYFTDAVVGNVTNAITGTKYINLYFDTGAVVNVRYTDEETPGFVFADGSKYVYDSVDEQWVVSSADAASDLWGESADTVDGLLGEGAIVAGATLSDLVAAPVDNAAVSFNAESAFDINAAGGFVAASTAATSEQKTA